MWQKYVLYFFNISLEEKVNLVFSFDALQRMHERAQVVKKC